MTDHTLRILTRDEVKKRKPPSYLISRIIPEGGFVSLVAQPSNKKTFVALNMACCVSSGTPFHGKPVRQGNVVYIMAEGQSGIEKRLCAWEAHNSVEIDPSTFGFILEPLHLNQTDAVERLVAALDAYVARVGQVDLIVVDTLNRSLDGDENAARDMSDFVKGITAIIARFNAAVLVLHHPAKTGTGGARGHSSLNGAVDLGLEIKNGQNMKFKLHCDAKPPKDDEPAHPIALEAVVVDLSDKMGFDDEGHPITSLALELVDIGLLDLVKTAPVLTLRQQLEETLPTIIIGSVMSTSEIVEQVLDVGIKVSPKTVNRCLRNLVNQGVLIRPEKGKYQCVEPQIDFEPVE
ncbi:AAA family ATPase [Roseobacter sp. HKCCD7870]|uniref:AAA family ATPase n=1 Tax=Roseobacter sp. HKCCD7870 TaxID=3120343 RepID=UPI0030EBFBAB